MTPSSDITFVLTSCGRFDLLAGTMVSFLEHNETPFARWLIVEDSGDASVRDVLGGLDVALEFIVNDPPLGQLASIDRAYAEVRTSLIFHCEDDWQFLRGGFVEESRRLLDALDDVSVVTCRRAGQNSGHDRIFAGAASESLGGVAFRRNALDAATRWGGYTFNPGLRRTADWRRIGAFAPFRFEENISEWYKERGMRMAALEHPACETTGSMRHVRNARTPQSPMRRAHERAVAAEASSTPRDAACPCGSGRRYGECHGADR